MTLPQRALQRVQPGLRRIVLLFAGRSSRAVAVALAVALAAYHVVHVLSEGTEHIKPGTYDRMVKQRLFVAEPDPRIVILDIDEKSLVALSPTIGLWPWPRDVLAGMLAYLERAGARAVVFDILIADPDGARPASDRAFAEAVTRSRIAYLPVLRLPPANDTKGGARATQLPALITRLNANAMDSRTFGIVPPYFAGDAYRGGLGTHNAYPDGDGRLRRYHYTEDIDGWRVWSLPARLAHDLTGDTPTGVRLIDWRREVLAYPRLSFADVYADAERKVSTRPPSEFAGRIVLIGSTAIGLHDNHATPIGMMHPGIDILATAIDDALHWRAQRELSTSFELPIEMAAIGLVLWLVLRLPHNRFATYLVRVPLALLLVSFLSMHWGPVFVDLSGAASTALAYFSAVKLHSKLQRDFWTDRGPLLGAIAPRTNAVALAARLRTGARVDQAEEEVMLLLARAAPQSRIVQRPLRSRGDLAGAVVGTLVVLFPDDDRAAAQRCAKSLDRARWDEVWVQYPDSVDQPAEATVVQALAQVFDVASEDRSGVVRGVASGARTALMS